MRRLWQADLLRYGVCALGLMGALCSAAGPSLAQAQLGPSADTLTSQRRGALDPAAPWLGPFESSLRLSEDANPYPFRAIPESGGPSLVADPRLPGADGNVLDICRDGNTLYLAGAFRSVGHSSGGFVAVDTDSGRAIDSFPRVTGFVHVALPDGAGGWYIGGEFTAVAGIPRNCLAHILADGSVSDWDPSVTGSPGYISPPSVWAIAMSGDRMMIGGQFREIGGQAHRNLGLIDLPSGEVLPVDLDTDETAYVTALAALDDIIFVGGRFAQVGGELRGHLAAVDARRGVILPWTPTIVGNSVRALLPLGDSLFVAGAFGGVVPPGEIRSVIRPSLAVLDIATGALRPFDARVDGIYVPRTTPLQIRALELVGDTLFVGGNFMSVGGRDIRSLAALDMRSGDALQWTPAELGPYYEGFLPVLVDAIDVAGDFVYIGGGFSFVGGLSRPAAARISRSTGQVDGWDPRPKNPVLVIRAQGDRVLLGGMFYLLGEWKHRAGLAAIDLTTGQLKPWNPNPNGNACYAIEARGGRVYASGSFTVIGGDPQPRSGFAELDTLNGEVTGWTADADNVAWTLVLRGDTLYAGGVFTRIGGQPRDHLAAIHAESGEVLTWAPRANGTVRAMEISGDTAFVAGQFNMVNDQWRYGIAAVSAADASLLGLDAGQVGFVNAIQLDGDRLYLGGSFRSVAGLPRTGLAAVDSRTGALDPWNPELSPWGVNVQLYALAMHEGQLWAGGAFGSVGGARHICLAAIDTSTGLASSWEAGANGYVWSFAAEDDVMYVGGGFDRMGGLPTSGLIAFSPPRDPEPPAPPTPPGAFGLARILPNPARASAVVRYALPRAEHVSLTVHDLQGRRMASPMADEWRAAGTHEVTIPVEQWKPGVYLYRLQAGGRVATRKFVVVE